MVIQISSAMADIAFLTIVPDNSVLATSPVVAQCGMHPSANTLREGYSQREGIPAR